MAGFYQKHLFFCINQRKSGKPCCLDHDAERYVDYAKTQLKAKNLWGPGKMRISRAGCLGRCKIGPNIVIYPDNVWYRYETEADIDEIIAKHLIAGEVVSRLCTDV